MTAGNMVINLKKTSMLTIILGSCVFVALGIWIIFTAQEPNGNQQEIYVAVLLYAIGGLSVTFFGLCLIVATWRSLSNTPGLELNDEGLTIFGIGKPLLISWREIECLSAFESQNQKFLVIHTHNPDKYIFNGGKIRENIAKASQKLCGGPISISTSTLNIQFDDLMDTCEGYLVTHRARDKNNL